MRGLKENRSGRREKAGGRVRVEGTQMETVGLKTVWEGLDRDLRFGWDLEAVVGLEQDLVAMDWGLEMV